MSTLRVVTTADFDENDFVINEQTQRIEVIRPQGAQAIYSEGTESNIPYKRVDIGNIRITTYSFVGNINNGEWVHRHNLGSSRRIFSTSAVIGPENPSTSTPQPLRSVAVKLSSTNEMLLVFLTSRTSSADRIRSEVTIREVI